MSRLLHASLDVRGALQMKRSLRGMFRDGDGHAMTNEAVRDVLFTALEQGKLRLPVGQPCDGFSYVSGCPGHEEG